MPTTDPSDLVKQHKERQEEAMLADLPAALSTCTDYYGRVLALAISTRDTTIRSLRADLAARDALIEEWREALRKIESEACPEDGLWFERITVVARDALLRTPSDARAELARLRETEENNLRALKGEPHEPSPVASNISCLRAQLATSTANLAHADEKISELQDFIKGQSAQLATAEADYLRGAKMLADNATVWKDRAEQAEARVKDLEQRLENRDAEVRFEMERADNSFKLRLQAEARLRAVTKAADAVRDELEKYTRGGDVTDFEARAKISAYDAAKSGELSNPAPEIDTSAKPVDSADTSGDLPPHPDTARLDHVICEFSSNEFREMPDWPQEAREYIDSHRAAIYPTRAENAHARPQDPPDGLYGEAQPTDEEIDAAREGGNQS